jgi:hypothetical protein
MADDPYLGACSAGVAPQLVHDASTVINNPSRNPATIPLDVAQRGIGGENHSNAKQVIGTIDCVSRKHLDAANAAVGSPQGSQDAKKATDIAASEVTYAKAVKAAYDTSKSGQQ